ncbi:hypothetical protein GCM10009069_02590 [Algimonas arctica]|uniref:Uncharacterized protein n=1 Tax=Algimonas arctica TaxID=1479486 RepID=A0A8J3CKP3_9PROT|nr:hypothetical protein [Algimonas arctica]GHA82851.1 hypothetical protein GCM10009069_02590 [Algimonas arctica]
MKYIAPLALFISLASVDWAYAQAQDEIIVTGSRISIQDEIPGRFLTVPGDNLLLEVEIESDARAQSERLTEIMDTIGLFQAAAMKSSGISLSFVDEGSIVRSLSPSVYEAAIGNGYRPDTSVATIQVKTAIPKNVSDTFAISTKLSKFVETIPERGRVTISESGSVVISVVDPQQYRPAVIREALDEVNAIQAQLGEGYRVILSDIDEPMGSFRAGDLSLGFFIPYDYVIVPDTLTALTLDHYDD